MQPLQLSQAIKSAAKTIGFDWCGICAAVTPPGFNQFQAWLDSGFHGQMEYLERRRDAYQHPHHVLEGAKSIVMLALNYESTAPPAVRPGSGRVSRYAWGERDYHDIIHQRLKSLKKQVLEWSPEANIRGVVDTAPLLEREFAVLSGLGWQGKNTLLINKWVGSWFFLAALIVDFELEFDSVHESEHCGTCRACLDACPTDAFRAPHLLDATRCISYLTIELRDPIPTHLRQPMGDWVFGCDVCQDVCPWNHKSQPTTDPQFQPRGDLVPMDLIELFDLTDEGFRQRFRKTPLWRSRRRGILRNAAIVLGNQREPSAIPALIRGLQDTEPLVRGASAWALHQFSNAKAQQAIDERLHIETDKQVLSELKGEAI